MLAGALLAQTTGPPIIQMGPQNQNVFAGATVMFNVIAGGEPPLSYQWFRQTAPIPSATSAMLKLTGVDEPDSGRYFVQVTNRLGTNRSGDAMLMVARADFGDAPAVYPTQLSGGGAGHLIKPGMYLGGGVSFEPDGQPSADGGADPLDDGVTFLSPLVSGYPCPVRVVASANGLLNGWIDFNANGGWEAGEQIFNNTALTPGTNTFLFQVPPIPTAVTTFARFRFSSATDLQPTGMAPDGEVEDYRLQILTEAADLSVNASISLNPTPPSGNPQALLTVSNFGPSPALNVLLSNNLSGVNIFGVPGTTCNVQGGIVNCVLGDLQPGETRTIRFDFQPKEPSLITNVLTARSDVFDPKTVNNRMMLVLRAAPPLIITSPPQDVKVLPGKSATFSVTAQGFGPLTYRWLLDGAAIAGATDSTLTLVNVRNSAEIRVQVTDSLDSILSPPAMLTVLMPPQIYQQPQPITVHHGSPVRFMVQAASAGSSLLQFQWRLNGANIPNATNQVYEIPATSRGDGGTYTVAVGGEGGVTVSEAAALICQDFPIFAGADDFAQRLPVAQAGTDPFQGVLQTDNFSATKEPGETNHAGITGSNSIWFQWTAPVDGIATFDTVGSTFDTVLAIYAGASLSSIVEVPNGSDDDRGGYFCSLVRFNVRAGQNYAIAVDGPAGKRGFIVLGWSVEPTQQFLPNIVAHPKSFTARSGAPFTMSVNATGTIATAQLFYQWLFNGIPIDTATDTTFTITNVTRTRVGSYSVRVFSSANRFVESRPGVLEIGPVPGIQSHDKIEGVLEKSNDSSGPGFRMAKSLLGGGPPFISVAFGIPGSQTMNTTNSTADVDCFRISSATRWLGVQVTNDPAAAGTLLRVDTAGSAVMTELAVYRFIAPSCLQLLACIHTNIMGCDTNTGAGGSYSLVEFTPVLGGLYIIFADGLSAQGQIQMNWQLGAPPILDPPDPDCVTVFPAGFPATLNSGVTNNPAPTPYYQWYCYGVPVSNGTNSTLVFTPIQSSNAGVYMVVVSNSLAVVTNSCCVIVDPPELRYEVLSTNWLNISAALLPGCVLQFTTNLSAPIAWENLITNTMTNCYFQFAAPLADTNPPRFYRAWKP